jgi:transcription-repair coupling factor (superfamily II helicase)
MRDMLGFFAPDIPTLYLPAWDCLPYDRLSPQVAVMSERMATLAQLQMLEGAPHILVTTISAAAQRLPSRDRLAGLSLALKPGNSVDVDALTGFLSSNGYARCSTVMEPGDYAVRGGIIDLYAPGSDAPVRLDLFGDTLESIRPFEAESQRTIGQLSALNLTAAGEIHLDEEAVLRFRRGYVRAFGTVMDNDPLYAAISDGARYQGMEHWLPLFHDTLETLFDHCGAALYIADDQTESALHDRHEQIADYYQARQEAMQADTKENDGRRIIKPLAPEALYILEEEWRKRIDETRWRSMGAFDHPDGINLNGRAGRSFAAERKQQDINLFDAVTAHIAAEQAAGRHVLLVASSRGAQERLETLLKEHGAPPLDAIATWQMPQKGQGPRIAIMNMDNGFMTETMSALTEQDILGDRMVRRPGRKKAENFLTEASSLTPGDHVVHVEHGIGRFEGLQTIDVGGAPHDCLKLIYHGDSRLFLPVENIELLSRFGGDDMTVTLDKIGGVAWQMRKARLKEKIKLIADELIKTAAARAMRDGEIMTPDIGLYDEFAARFPFEETEDQLDAIEAVIDDLGSGRPMDRLICGDVGFGKTEVGLRAAFIAAMSGKQVAIVAPTTLLARQHAKTFKERFAGLPVEIAELSRLVSTAAASQTKEGLASGAVDIVIGTHALLAKNISFARLGMVIVDEEQHFGVVHKERLKSLRAEVHMLTLTATPIPRTLQMALTGVRDLSLIATPPVDRLAVRTYVTPFDPVGIREALLREKYRTGQSFIIVPRIADLPDMEAYLAETVPEVKYVTAHGQMAGGELETRMNAFYDGQYDVLLSTSIIESGLDIPSANTIIIHRADMFGLAQLYQMRGRVGRSKTRAYGYLTYNENRGLTDAAEKRLKVMQSLDSLGAGFNLASYDLDLRGAGNLVGEEQSGHIKEVGYELYQAMLEEAVAERQGEAAEESWAPQINVGISVLIPETYVPDLDLRMGLYRRLSSLTERADIDAFAAEIVDRFGRMPPEVAHLLAVLTIKIDCLAAGIEKIDAGPKGIAVVFRNQSFANPEKLLAHVTQNQERIKIRPDQSLVFRAKAEDADERLRISALVAGQLAELAA